MNIQRSILNHIATLNGKRKSPIPLDIMSIYLTVKIQGPFSSYLSSMHPDSTIFETKKRDEKACTKQTMDQNQSPTRIGYVTGSQPKGRDYYFDSFKNTLFK